jgi:hypothetical protein
MCFLFLISCNDKTQSENTNVAQTETQYPESEPQIIQNMSEKEALDFVETWKNIFATHTIDNYIKLYDPVSFVGIKRTYNGQKNTYDYNGWVQNKKNEFRKFSPDVYLENVRVKWINKKGLTKVSFLQTWVSTINGNYADRGEKELVLKKVNDEIYIVREELLYSQRYDEYFYGD